MFAAPSTPSLRATGSRERLDAVTQSRGGHHDCHWTASTALVEIEERVDQIECELALVAPLVHERARLLRARAALLGQADPAPLQAPGAAGSAGRAGVTREEVFAYLIRCPGSSPGEIARGLGAGQPAIAAHLHRGKGAQFSAADGRWYPIPRADADAPLEPVAA
jgi:hypothetical protein